MKSLLRISSMLLCLIIWIPNGYSQTVQIQVDAAQNKRPVSPYIYGANNFISPGMSNAELQRLRDAGFRMFRENGGNNATKYNWRRKLSSHPDWYNNVYDHDWDGEAKLIHDNLPGVQGMFAFQLIGKAAKTKSNNFNDWAYNGSKYWPGVAQNLAGGGVVDSDWNATKAAVEGDINLYLENWTADSTVGILDHWFKTLNLNKKRFEYWNMDNEPEIWYGTHDDVYPVQPPAEEFMQKYFAVARKARAKFPDIKLVGFVPCSEWYWYAYNQGGQNKISYNGKSYTWIEYFIKRIADEQNTTGERLVDVIDLHTYLSADNDANFMQLHRVFYDENYVYPKANGVKLLGANGWDNSINKEYIFKRINDWLDQYMGAGHGVTIGSTESGGSSGGWDSKFTQMPQALNYASILGVFMNEGVEVYTPWMWNPSYTEVLHLYSRYNKNISVKSTSSDDNFVSAYSTVNTNNDSVTVVIVNRYSTAKAVDVSLSNINIPNGTYNVLTLNNLPTDNDVETFVSHTNNALKSSTVSVNNKVFNINVPARSITSVILGGISGPTLSVSPTTKSFTAAGSNTTINVSSNVNWSASSNQSWLTVSPQNGSNNGQVTLTATANTGAARSAEVTISGTGVSSVKVTVNQAAPPVLNVSATTLNIGAANGSTGTFNITSNISWTVSSSATWLSASPASGSNNSGVTLTATANPSTTTTRTATITVSGTGATSKQITVTQAKAAATLTVSPTSRNVTAAAGSTSFSVTSNIAWTASENLNWLSVSSSTTSGNGTVQVTYEANSSTANTRSGSITIQGGGITRNVTVTQAKAAPVLNVSTNTVNVAAPANSSNKINVTSNISWSVSESIAWLSVSPSVTSGNGEITFTATAENTAATNRSGTVTVSGGGISRQITVVQLGTGPSMLVSKNALSIDAAENSKDSFIITSNTDWAVSVNKSWLSLSATSGSDNGTIVVTAEENSSVTDPRTATITVSGNSGNITKTITVTQAATAAILSVATNALTIGATTGSTTDFKVTSNISWTASSDNTWLVASPVNFTGDGTVTLTVAETNPNVTTRSAVVTISGGGMQRKITVVQEASEPSLSVSVSEITLNWLSSTRNVTVTSTVNWTVSSSESWLTVSSSSGSGNAVIQVIAEANSVASDRTATLTFTGSGLEPVIIDVTQLAYSDITAIDPEPESLKAEKIWPNPVTDMVYIRMPFEVTSFDAGLYSLSGKLIKTIKSASSDLDMDMSEYNSGIYILKIVSAGKTFEHKLIKR